MSHHPNDKHAAYLPEDVVREMSSVDRLPPCTLEGIAEFRALPAAVRKRMLRRAVLMGQFVPTPYWAAQLCPNTAYRSNLHIERFYDEIGLSPADRLNLAIAQLELDIAHQMMPDTPDMKVARYANPDAISKRGAQLAALKRLRDGGKGGGLA